MREEDYYHVAVEPTLEELETFLDCASVPYEVKIVLTKAHLSKALKEGDRV